MAVDELIYTATPFEGPEKLLEIWFAPSAAHVPDAFGQRAGKIGLRKIAREIWEGMLEIVKCKVLSFIEGQEIDAYLLSESSLFVFPHRIILKTCGTTLNLLGLPRILEIAREYAALVSVYRCFYSRKSFMFPERQQGPHREWKDEVNYLDTFFPNGAAYTVGKVNGDHWLLYLTTPNDSSDLRGCVAEFIETPITLLKDEHQKSDVVSKMRHLADSQSLVTQDYTIEILMSDLSAEARELFFFSGPPSPSGETPVDLRSNDGLALSSAIGISDLFPAHLTNLDAYAFTPCGYSSNAILKWGTSDEDCPAYSGEGYYTIHVTPEEGWSYASFECNVPLSTVPSSKDSDVPDLETLIRRVVNIFQPFRLTLTLFISSTDNNNAEDEKETAVEAAQRAFRVALSTCHHSSSLSSASRAGRNCGEESSRERYYKRTDKINYEFGGYDFAFASFELQ